MFFTLCSTALRVTACGESTVSFSPENLCRCWLHSTTWSRPDWFSVEIIKCKHQSMWMHIFKSSSHAMIALVRICNWLNKVKWKTEVLSQVSLHVIQLLLYHGQGRYWSECGLWNDEILDGFSPLTLKGCEIIIFPEKSSFYQKYYQLSFLYMRI